jgi:hypothetical protein
MKQAERKARHVELPEAWGLGAGQSAAERKVVEEVMAFKAGFDRKNKGARPGEWTTHLLNNFFTKVPGSGAGGAAMYEPMFASRMDVTFGEMLGRGSRFSPHYLKKTPRQFFADARQAAEEAGLDGKAFAKLVDRKARLEAPGSEGGDNQGLYIEICRAALPVYVKMRAKGYGHQELWT